MDCQIRFHYAGSWTRWYDIADESLFMLKGIEVDSVEVSETMTREEFRQRFPDHVSLQPPT